jgi:hypothetical protein
MLLFMRITLSVATNYACGWRHSAVGAAFHSMYVDGVEATLSLDAVPRGRWTHVHVQLTALQRQQSITLMARGQGSNHLKGKLAEVSCCAPSLRRLIDVHMKATLTIRRRSRCMYGAKMRRSPPRR